MGRQGIERLRDSAEGALTATSEGKVTAAVADAIVTRGMRIPRLYRKVTLTEQEKHIYTIDGGKSWAISAEGYSKINEVAGARFVMAPTVSVDGAEKSNPYVVRDPVSGEIKDVYVSGVLLARSLNGNLLPLVETINVSPGDYFRSELVKVCRMGDVWDNSAGGYVPMKDWSDDGRLCALAEFAGKPLPEGHALYPIDDVVGCLVNLASPTVGRAIQTQREHVKFATRRASTILIRRLSAKHPGLPGQHLKPDLVKVTEEKRGTRTYRKDATADLTVLGWVELDDGAAMRDVALAVSERFEALPSNTIDLGSHAYTADSDDEGRGEEKPADAVVSKRAEPPTDAGEDAPSDAQGDDAGRLALAQEVGGLMSALKALPGGADALAGLWDMCISDAAIPLQEQPQGELEKFRGCLTETVEKLDTPAE